MARGRDLLDRFRPLGTPGPLRVLAVPTDPRRDAAEELAPVLAALSATAQECTAIRETAHGQAAERLATAQRRAAAVVAAARDEATAARAAAAARARDSGDAEARELLARGEDAAARVDEGSAGTADAVAAAVVADLRAALLDRAVPAP